MLEQLQSELATGNKYDVISIWGGVNDIYATNSINSAENNLQAMYDLAKGTGAVVVALTVPPTKTYTSSNPTTVSLTNQLNDWIFANKSIDGLVDVNGLVNNGNDGTLPQYLGPDTLHLTAAGQQVISQDFVNDVIDTGS
jgi:lysophospholipase L1-like esterase